MKKIFTLLPITVVFCFLFGISAFADDANHTAARYIPCEICGIGRIIESNTDYGSWSDTSESQDCVHGGKPYYKDKQQSRVVTTNYRCTHCGGTSYYTRIEYRWICLMPKR